MNRISLLNTIQFSLSFFSTQIKILNRNKQYDINILAESIFIRILNIVYNLDLINLNIKNNEKGIDLGDLKKGTAFQITSSNRAEKIYGTIEKFPHNKYKKLIHFILADEKVKIKKIDCQFQIEIIDLGDLYKLIATLQDIDKISSIAIIFEKEILGSWGLTLNNYNKNAINIKEKGDKLFSMNEVSEQYQYLIKELSNNDNILSEEFKDGNIQKVKNILIKNIETKSKRIAETYFLIAQISEMQYEYDNALKYYEKAFENSPENIEYLSELSNFYYIVGQENKAFNLVNSYLNILNKSKDTIKNKILILENNLKIAQEENNKYKEITHLANLSGLYGWNSDFDKAKYLLKDALQKSIEFLGKNHKRTQSIKYIYSSTLKTLNLLNIPNSEQNQQPTNKTNVNYNQTTRNNNMIIQFIHDGPEHRPTKGNIKDWNYGKHKRKFLSQKGQYVKDINIDSKRYEDELMFWAEWEPQSTVKRRLTHFEDLPRYLYEPWFDLSAPLTNTSSRSGNVCAVGNRQNSDPFIFGKEFYYFVCKQKRKTGYTMLTDLQPGDIILFGSKLKGHFVLDTVFVISDAKPITYIPENIDYMIKPNVSDEYYNISFVSAFWRDLKKHQTPTTYPQGYKLYSGATIDNPYNGMFSFVPVKSDNQKGIGFERPQILSSSYVNPDLMMNYRTRQTSQNEAKNFWIDIASQVLAKDLFLGTKFEMPKNMTPVSFNERAFINKI